MKAVVEIHYVLLEHLSRFLLVVKLFKDGGFLNIKDLSLPVERDLFNHFRLDNMVLCDVKLKEHASLCQYHDLIAIKGRLLKLNRRSFK